MLFHRFILSYARSLIVINFTGSFYVVLRTHSYNRTFSSKRSLIFFLSTNSKCELENKKTQKNGNDNTLACNVITEHYKKKMDFFPRFFLVQKCKSTRESIPFGNGLLVLLMLLFATTSWGKMKWKYSLWLFANSHCCGKIFICKLKFPFHIFLSHFMCHKRFIRKHDGNGVCMRFGISKPKRWKSWISVRMATRRWQFPAG